MFNYIPHSKLVKSMYNLWGWFRNDILTPYSFRYVCPFFFQFDHRSKTIRASFYKFIYCSLCIIRKKLILYFLCKTEINKIYMVLQACPSTSTSVQELRMPLATFKPITSLRPPREYLQQTLHRRMDRQTEMLKSVLNLMLVKNARTLWSLGEFHLGLANVLTYI